MQTEKIPVVGSETREKHIEYIWDNFVAKANAKTICVLTHGYGESLYRHLVQERTGDVMKRVVAGALVDGWVDDEDEKDDECEEVRRYSLSGAIAATYLFLLTRAEKEWRTGRHARTRKMSPSRSICLRSDDKLENCRGQGWRNYACQGKAGWWQDKIGSQRTVSVKVILYYSVPLPSR